MIRCTKCGTINAEGDIFCSKCASFLEWTGVKVDASALEPPSTEPTPEPPAPEPPAPEPPAAEQPASVPPAAEPPEAPEPPTPQPPTPEPPAAAEPPAPEPAASAAPEAPPEAAPETAPPPAPPPPPELAALGGSSPFGGYAPPPAAPPEPVPEPPPAPAVQPPPVEPEPVKPAPPPPPPPATYRFRAGKAAGASSAAPAPPAAAQTGTGPSADLTQTAQPYEPPAVKPASVQPPARPPQAAAPDQPRSRQPTLATAPPRPVAQPRQTLAAEPEIRPGDLICAVCGAGNTPDRKFCRRCGNSLAAATVAVAAPVPWYRRLFGRRQPQVMVAGERPATMGRVGRSAGWWFTRLLLLVVILVIVLPVVGYFTIPSVKTQIDSLIGKGGTQAVLLQHQSNNALDKDVNTYWLADQASGDTSLTVTFNQTTSLVGLRFYSGATAPDYASYGRPRQVDLIFPGSPQPVTILLDDDPAVQLRCLKTPQQVATFSIRITSSYPPQTGSQNLVALREVEFIAGSCQ